MTKFREHGVMIFLSGDLYRPFVKLQADKGLGRSFAALLPFVEGLYSMGYIDKQIYEQYKKKYSRPYGIRKTLKDFTEPSPGEELDKLLKGVLDQWKLHKNPKWRRKWLTIARQHPDLAHAQQLLTLEQKVKH